LYPAAIGIQPGIYRFRPGYSEQPALKNQPVSVKIHTGDGRNSEGFFSGEKVKIKQGQPWLFVPGQGFPRIRTIAGVQSLRGLKHSCLVKTQPPIKKRPVNIQWSWGTFWADRLSCPDRAAGFGKII